MKQGKKRASSEIQDVENSGNFCKLVLVPRLKKKKSGSSKLVPVPAKANLTVHFWYRYRTY